MHSSHDKNLEKETLTLRDYASDGDIPWLHASEVAALRSVVPEVPGYMKRGQNEMRDQENTLMDTDGVGKAARWSYRGFDGGMSRLERDIYFVSSCVSHRTEFYLECLKRGP